MMESALTADKDRAKTIRTLSDQLQASVHEVGEIYRLEFDRLARGARIPTYLSVLAMSHTRAILREGRRRLPLH